MDIYTRENLTEALMAYTGTLLLVTHDRHLMNSLACPILYLEDGKATLYPSYDALMGRNAPAPAVQKAAEPAKTGYGKEQRRRRAELRAKIKACEDEMEACGAREVELDYESNSPEVDNDPDLLRQKSDELSDLRFHQEELFAAWAAAMEEQESYEQSQQTEHRHDQNGFPVPGRKFGYPFAALGRQLCYPETVLCGGGCTLCGGLSGLPCSFGVLLFDTLFLPHPGNGVAGGLRNLRIVPQGFLVKVFCFG